LVLVQERENEERNAVQKEGDRIEPGRENALTQLERKSEPVVLDGVQTKGLFEQAREETVAIAQLIESGAIDHSKQEQKQEVLTGDQSQLPSQPDEVENVVVGLPGLDYAYKTFLFPVLEASVPIDSTDDYKYYTEAWKWYVSPYVMPVYWSYSGLGRAQVGLDVGRYFNGNSSLQFGLRYQLSSGDPRMGDSGVLTLPVQYRRYFGRSQFRWFLGAGVVIMPGLSPGTPFDSRSFEPSWADLEFSGGLVYHPSDQLRFFISPGWQLPLFGDHGVSVQLGLQFRF